MFHVEQVLKGPGSARIEATYPLSSRRNEQL